MAHWIRPTFSPQAACALAGELFGIDADESSCQELDSYDDQNFHVRSKGASAGEFVIKIHNAQDAHDLAHLQVRFWGLPVAVCVAGAQCKD